MDHIKIKNINNKDSFEWKAYEHEYKDKSVDWFWAVGIIAIALAVTAVILDNLLFGVLVIIATFALIVQSIKRPKELLYKVENDGVSVGKTVYKYNSLESFWVSEQDNKLILKSKKVAVPYIIIPLSDEISENSEETFKKIRKILSKNLKEEEMTEPLSQKIMEKLGF